jgi:hypothetical protein
MPGSVYAVFWHVSAGSFELRSHVLRSGHRLMTTCSTGGQARGRGRAQASGGFWEVVGFPGRVFARLPAGNSRLGSESIFGEMVSLSTDFDSPHALAEYLERSNRTVAQVRIHGTTRQQVLRHFLEVERPARQPLPSEPFGLFQVAARPVHTNGHVEVDGAFYSVPHTLVGESVRAQWDGHLVRIYKPEHRPRHRPA